MVEINEKMEDKKLQSKMLVQVHDELVFEVLPNEEETLIKLVKNIMENTYKLNVPLEVDVQVGYNWYDAK